MLVGEAMTRGIRGIQAGTSLRHAAQLMRDQDIGMVLVEGEQGDIAGLITDRDITCRAVAEGIAPEAPVEGVMSAEPISCHVDDDLYQAVEAMKQEKVRRLLVRNQDEEPVGVLAQADVAAAIATYGLAGEMLEEISQPGGRHSH